MAKTKSGINIQKTRTVAKIGNSAKSTKKIFGKWQPSARIRSVKQ